jgi:hypothetical protein
MCGEDGRGEEVGMIYHDDPFDAGCKTYELLRLAETLGYRFFYEYVFMSQKYRARECIVCGWSRRDDDAQNMRILQNMLK